MRLKREREKKSKKGKVLWERKAKEEKKRQKKRQETTKEKREKEWKTISDKREFVHQIKEGKKSDASKTTNVFTHSKLHVFVF